MASGCYFDDDSEAKAVARALASDLTVLRATDAGMRGHSDEAHLAFATCAGLVLVTANRGDFLRLHSAWMAQGRSHGGIIILPQQRFSPGEVIRRLRLLLSSLSDEEFRDRVEFLNNWT